MDVAGELERHHHAAYGWALHCCRWDASAAEDVLQGSYLKILDGRATFGERSAFKTWLFGVIRRTAAEYRRRHLWSRVLPLALLNGRQEGRAPEHDPVSTIMRSEATAQLIAALRVLPERQRHVLHLVFYQELSIAEAATVLGVSLGTARTHYERGKAALKRTLVEEP